jgi:hypothetical protein
MPTSRVNFQSELLSDWYSSEQGTSDVLNAH